MSRIRSCPAHVPWRTAKLPELRQLEEPLQTEEVSPRFGKSGCRDLHPLEEGTPLFQRVFEEYLSSSKRILPDSTGQKKNPPPMKEMGFGGSLKNL